MLALFLLLVQFKQAWSTPLTVSSCYDGEYIVPIPPFGHCAGYRPCEPGFYCSEGIRRPCPAGVFGNRSSLNSSTCSGACPEAFYCPTGTVNFAQFPCGNASVYCPQGSSQPSPCPEGYYTITPDGLDGSEGSGRVDTRICPLGHYCTAGVRHACPGGTYGSSTGLSEPACSGVCPVGYYCPVGSFRPFDYPCGLMPSRYCPAGSTHPLPVGLGYYTLPGEADGYVAQVICPLGSFCVDGRRALCPAGRYGGKVQETSPLCSGICRAGFYCPEGSIISTQRQCDQTNSFCPSGSQMPSPVSQGFYSVSSQRNLSQHLVTYDLDGNVLPGISRTSEVVCEAGYWCADGIKRMCPSGRYGASTGLSHPRCSGACQEGYYCPEASTSLQQVPCGGVDVFCPPASSTPQHVLQGYYTISSSEDHGAESTRTAERRCEPGFYCSQGVKALCWGGFYGDAFGQTSPQCSGACAAGYYCPNGSTNARELLCGDASRYCPVNSIKPLAVSLGFYSTDGQVSSRSGQRVAPPGAYAVNGLLYPCPAGYYGSTHGLYTEICSGRCDLPGFYCPSKSHPACLRALGVTACVVSLTQVLTLTSQHACVVCEVNGSCG